jgi:4-amino-4-deoxy-L-arabinose transferase-like glycosyltransferase
VVGLWLRRWAGRTDAGLSGYLLWGSWFAVTAVVFSYMSGVVHSYYAVALAPAIAALVGAGIVDLWSLRVRVWLGGLAVGLASLGTAWFGWQLLDRTPGFAASVGPAAVILAGLALLALVIASLSQLRESETMRRIAVVAASVGLSATLMAPAAYAVSTIGNAYGGGDPHPGPGTTDTGFGGSNRAGGLPGDGGGLGGNTSDSALLSYLVANQGSATWIVAINSAQEAGSIELATGLPVMAMGGFTGSDPTPTLDQLKSYVASGKLRFVLASGGGFGGGGFGGGSGGVDTSSERTTWVTSTCKVVSYGGSASLYDCAGAA